MKLIVDSGSTKTDWFYASSLTDYMIVRTNGINPVIQNRDEIRQIVTTMCLQNVVAYDAVEEVHFYGAGCIPQKKNVLESILKETFHDADVNVESDLLAAARALCGTNEGLAAILGTGSNSCLYDGKKIVSNTPALGFILGDEGSGAVLGRKFINGIIKGWLPSDLCESFYNDVGLSTADIIDKVYKQPSPNRFLASMSKFILKNVDNFQELAELVIKNFEEFISININPYSRQTDGIISDVRVAKTINAVGSIAYYYKKQLAIAAQNRGYRVGKVMKSPVVGLLEFHFQ